MYAIVDIETTGGYAANNAITEVAIVLHDGNREVRRYETLVKPGITIPRYVQALTGITDELVEDAPFFDDIAPFVYDLLKDTIFVAHNVNFDYSFVHHQLEQAGFKWSAKKLCTVRAARKIKPGLGSYSLGNLCNSLNISLENRHRAGGDADATALLFSLLLEWDDAGEIEKMIKKTAQDQRLPPNLPPDDFNNLPDKPGVYYFYNQAKKVIYVGKAINLKKRVSSHFTGNNINPQRQHFLRDIHGISFEVCATELMALLLECTEIKKLWPTYNRALKRFEAKFGIYQYEARNGYKYLAIGKVSKFQVCIHEFSSLYEGINLLRSLAERFEIDHRFCKYSKSEEGDFFQNNNNPQSLPDVLMHNAQVDNAIDYLLNNRPSFAIIDKGKSKEERSCIWIENGHFYGMGYLPSDISIHEPSDVKNYVTPYKSNQYIEQLIFSYAEKHPRKVFFKKHLLA